MWGASCWTSCAPYQETLFKTSGKWHKCAEHVRGNGAGWKLGCTSVPISEFFYLKQMVIAHVWQCLHPTSMAISAGHHCHLVILQVTGATPADGHSLWVQRIIEYFFLWNSMGIKHETYAGENITFRRSLQTFQSRGRLGGELQVKERIRSGWLGMWREKEECRKGSREGKAGKLQHSDKFSSESKLQGEGRIFLPQTSELSEILPCCE